MNKLAIIAPDKELAKLCEKVTANKDFSAEISISIGSTNNGITMAKKEKENGAEVIISRGGTAILIRNEIVEIPVVEVEVTAFDLIYSFNNARQWGKKIIIVGFENVINAIRGIDHVLEDMSNLEIITEKVDAEYEITGIVKKNLAKFGPENLVFIGGKLVVEKAKEIGCHAVVLQSAPESVIRAINEAIRLARTIRSEKARTNQFKTILEYISDGVLAVNSRGEVTVYNKAAENIIGVAKLNVLGRPAQEVIQNTRMHEVLETGVEEVGVLQEIGNTTIVTNRSPILVDNKTVGAVATFQNVTELQQMEQQVRRKLSRRGLMAKWNFDDIIGKSPVMKKTVKRALKFAEVENTILLSAETGSGKEIFAQSIHHRSKRKNGPFVAINCAALPETLLEGELFGYAEGAFTGAVKGGKSGLFELAHGGTIFLDEIGEISKHMQTLFLRVLQEKEVRRVGDDRVIPIDVRVIAASNQDLGILVQNSKFRADLYYRINVLNLEIPPLRERREDIPLLASNILSNFNKRSMINLTFDPQALKVLKSYFWPGNVRQLENVLERLFVIAEDNVIKGNDVENALSSEPKAAKPEFNYSPDAMPALENIKTNRFSKIVNSKTETPETGTTKEGLLSEIEKETIINVLNEVNGRKQEAAHILGISSTTLWRRLKKLGINA
jgi:PAS domain S-box-containing protein